LAVPITGAILVDFGVDLSSLTVVLDPGNGFIFTYLLGGELLLLVEPSVLAID
jgi:hypothetical protein